MRSSTVAANAFRLDIKGVAVRGAFTAAGIRSVLLKGRAFATLLYDDAALRRYTDVDLLIRSSDAGAARAVLARLGFKPFDLEAPSGQTDASLAKAIEAQGAIHGGAWWRASDGVMIDLHHSLPQVIADRDVLWREITQHLDIIDVAGEPTEVLDRPASALLVALHAAHHGPEWGGALQDLARAVDVFDLGCWQEARDLAVTLEADVAMGVGLGLQPEGVAVAHHLGLATEPSSSLRLLWAGAPWSASFLEALIGQAAMRDRMHLLARLLWPAPHTMRRGSALARRGPRGLIGAYALRPFQLLRRLPGGVSAWRRLT